MRGIYACRACGEPRVKGHKLVCKGGAVSKRAEPAPAQPAANGHELAVGASYGFRASADPEAGELTLAQDRPTEDGDTSTHEILLTREDARRLLDWVSEVAA